MKLYKYCIADRVDVIENRRIRFSPPAALNDPFEVSPAVHQAIPREKVAAWVQPLLPTGRAEIESMIRTMLASNPELTRRAAAMDPSMNEFLYDPDKVIADLATELPAMLSEFIGPVNEQLQHSMPDVFRSQLHRMGILCLTEHPDNHLMWSHYADSHRGIVLEFDAAHPFFDQRTFAEDEFRCLKRVTYAEARPSVTLFDPIADPALVLANVAQESFYTKGLHWEYEAEWRMVRPLEEAEDTRLSLFSFPPAALTGVILGSHATTATKERCAMALEMDGMAHVAMWKAYLTPTDYRVRVEKLR